jgi:hypothetical protein
MPEPLLPLTSASGPYMSRWRPTSGPLDPTIQPILSGETETSRDVHAAVFLPLWRNQVCPLGLAGEWQTWYAGLEKRIYTHGFDVLSPEDWQRSRSRPIPGYPVTPPASSHPPPIYRHLVFRHEELHANSCGWSSVVTRQVRSRSVSHRAMWFS